jgi:hypothetical protein
MRKLIAVPAVLGAILLVSGCSSVPEQQLSSVDTATARQNVKIYDAIPPNGTPIEQLSATACNGTSEAATDRLIALTSQRGGNGIAQLSCTAEGISLACWSSAICTGMAINVVEPPPKPVAPPPKRAKPKPKAKKP